MARERDRERFRCEQPTYSILARGIEKDVLPTLGRYGMGAISCGPLAGGWLSGRYARESTEAPIERVQRPKDRFDTARPENQRKLEAAMPSADWPRVRGSA